MFVSYDRKIEMAMNSLGLRIRIVGSVEQVGRVHIERNGSCTIRSFMQVIENGLKGSEFFNLS